jgi:hypothetical protein
MKNALWLVIGVAIGLLAGQRLAKGTQNQELLGTLDARAREFGKTVADSYKAREAELRAAIAKVDGAIDDLRK